MHHTLRLEAEPTPRRNSQQGAPELGTLRRWISRRRQFKMARPLMYVCWTGGRGEAPRPNALHTNEAMSTRDPAPPEGTRAKHLRFDRYVLDLGRGCLLLDGNDIVLRPKTFSVLSYLVENSGRLVSKDELFSAVWPNVAVTDDTLVQSISELRRVMGDDGARLIRTIPRRGYRFEAAVTDPATLSAHAPTTEPDAAGAPVAPSELPEKLANVPVTTSRSRFGSGVLAASAVLVSVLVIVVAYAAWSTKPNAWLPSSMLARLNGSRPSETDARPAIAILPFLNQGGDSSRDYFADGLTQDLITALGRFSALTVMSWNAVSAYRRASATPGEIARRLGVRYQVEGSVLQTGDRVRVAAQLVDSDGRVLWSARFDEPYSDLFVLQDKITTQVAGVLAIRVSEIEQRRVLAKPRANLAAYDYVLRARPALQRPTRAELVQARSLLRRAIEIDPNYAAAYAALAETYFTATSMGWAESPSETVGRAEDMANKALALDESDVRAHIILGRIDIFYQRYEQARVEMDRAIALNPNDAHALAGRGNIRMWLGETDAAIEDLELALRIDPELIPMDRFALSLAYYLKGRYNAAIEQAALNLQRTEGANFSRVVLAAAYAEQNKDGEVARVVAAIRRVDPTFDAQDFGSKFLKPEDLAHLRDGLRKAGLYAEEAGPRSDH
jgi:TolB-like protein/DNA-binding winged helix-turn-helix (wHTH) protein/Tfp pilus assembly protein PilF